jgi:hypothetical protein
MAKPPSRAAERRARRQAQAAEEEQAALGHWFTVSGSTMTDLSAAIARWQPGDRPTDLMGIHPKVIAVMEHPQIDPDSKIRIVRAMLGSFACCRPRLADGRNALIFRAHRCNAGAQRPPAV